MRGHRSVQFVRQAASLVALLAIAESSSAMERNLRPPTFPPPAPRTSPPSGTAMSPGHGTSPTCVGSSPGATARVQSNTLFLNSPPSGPSNRNCGGPTWTQNGWPACGRSTWVRPGSHTRCSAVPCNWPGFGYGACSGVYIGGFYVDPPADAYEAAAVTEPDEPEFVAAEPIPSVSSGPDDSRVAVLLAAGERELRAGRFDEAREALGAALQISPSDPQCLLPFGISSLALGNYRDAAGALHDLVAASPDLARTPLDLRQRFGASNLATIRRGLEALSNPQPDGGPLQFLLGFVQFFGGEPITGRETLRGYVAANRSDQAARQFFETIERVTPPRR